MTSEGRRRGPGRPHAASREAVEQIALALMLRDGYDAVSVDAIASEAGIGRTTFFRYFGSKHGVIWAPFDATLAWMEESLHAVDRDDDPLTAVRKAVVSSTRAAVWSSDVWLERFQLLDSHPSLRAEAYEHWERWKAALTGHLTGGSGPGQGEVMPAAIAGACHGVFLAELRHWQNADDDRDGLLLRLDESLRILCEALRPVLRSPR
jgi:AcrR family transcriptional regulator